ncbi:small-subunit processome [Pisolithus marmoratus]|nr:small-subunit processome [Pisolithus marmoratus]
MSVVFPNLACTTWQQQFYIYQAPDTKSSRNHRAYEMARTQKGSKQAHPKKYTSVTKGRPGNRPTHRANATSKARTAAAINDVYEDLPEKNRRGTVGLDLDKYERQGRRRDSEVGLGVSAQDVERLSARLLGENDEDEQLGSDDDEEIDSEDAFEDSDEEGFAESSFGKKREESSSNQGSDSEEESGSEAGDEDEDDFQISASESGSEASPEALAELNAFLSTLDPAETKKRKQDEEETPNKKRRILPERMEPGEESEFGARGASTLGLDDLLAPLASSSALTALKKSTKALTSSSAKTKTLPAPLPQRAQERLDREAAYEKTKEEVDKWNATMKRIKQAEHLSFPLQAEPASRVSNFELAAKFQPSNEFESAVDKLLKSAQLRDEDIAHTESLKMAHLTVEEVAARRAELRMMRELAFRADRKAKRVAKIKSKAYRRIRKKQRERLDVPVEDEDVDEEARMKAEVERARERATLKHKATGKWARSMQGREGLDQDQRQAIAEMLERGEKLRRRIRGEDSGSESDGESESGDEELDEEGIRRKAFEELENIRTEGEGDTSDLKSKSVFSMKFMQEAATRRAQEANAQAEELAREMALGLGDAEGSESGDIMENGATRNSPVVQRTGGRISFRPGASAAATSILKSLGSLASDTSSVTLQSADLVQDAHVTPQGRHSPTPTLSTVTPVVAASEPNPWLAPVASSRLARKKNETVVHKNADALAKSANKLKKQAAKGKEEKERAQDDAVLEIEIDKALTIPDPPTTSSSAKKKGKAAQKPKQGNQPSPSAELPADDDDSDVHSEIEEQERIASQAVNTKGIKAFQQRELVALAFAGDNVVEAFEEAKRQEIEADAPREVDTTLPGWGSWGGTGIMKPPPKPRLIKKVAGVDPSNRADFKKAHVIISEKRDKKAAKYLVKDLPYPYTSYAQFEKSMDTPLGTEWNTRVGFQRATLPRVVRKMGTVIDPLEKLA